MTAQWKDSWPRFVVETDTDAARAALARYFAIDDQGQPAFTGAHFEHFADGSQPNAITERDLVAISMLSVTVPARAAIRLLDTDRGEISALLAEVPADVDIVDARKDVLSSDSAAGELWRLLRGARDGLGPTMTSKLLAAKRPRLLPVWDSLVGEATGVDTRDYWRCFQAVLLSEDRRIWDWLCRLTEELGQSHPVSPLRVLDVLLWMSAERVVVGAVASPE